ncbi:zinc finger, CCHC-type containing protein [Tanacetum coccineum]|uniref:Zinc finger, CCHC-type containing protein n=1 Tax=Tanacetum coccineum TaxID=301880 RepID=A0ABQ5BVF4_9ASTR
MAEKGWAVHHLVYDVLSSIQEFIFVNLIDYVLTRRSTAHFWTGVVTSLESEELEPASSDDYSKVLHIIICSSTKAKLLGQTPKYPYEDRLKSQDSIEANDKTVFSLTSSNTRNYGKWRSKGFNKESKESMKWQDNPNERRASTSQGTQDKSKIRCYECGEHGHFRNNARVEKTTNTAQEENSFNL